VKSFRKLLHLRTGSRCSPQDSIRTDFKKNPNRTPWKGSEPAGRASANVGVARRLRRATSVASVGESQTSEVSFKVINSFEYQEDCFVRCSASHLHSLRSLRAFQACLAPLTPSELARTKVWRCIFLKRIESFWIGDFKKNEPAVRVVQDTLRVSAHESPEA